MIKNSISSPNIIKNQVTEDSDQEENRSTIINQSHFFTNEVINESVSDDDNDDIKHCKKNKIKYSDTFLSTINISFARNFFKANNILTILVSKRKRMIFKDAFIVKIKELERSIQNVTPLINLNSIFQKKILRALFKAFNLVKSCQKLNLGDKVQQMTILKNIFELKTKKNKSFFFFQLKKSCSLTYFSQSENANKNSIICDLDSIIYKFKILDALSKKKCIYSSDTFTILGKIEYKYSLFNKFCAFRKIKSAKKITNPFNSFVGKIVKKQIPNYCQPEVPVCDEKLSLAISFLKNL